MQKTRRRLLSRNEELTDAEVHGRGASRLPVSDAEVAPRLLVLELKPVDAVGAAILVVVPAVGAAAVHQHAVQAVLVAFAAVRVRGQVLAVADVEVQLLIELIPVVDLRPGSRTLRMDFSTKARSYPGVIAGESERVSLAYRWQTSFKAPMLAESCPGSGRVSSTLTCCDFQNSRACGAPSRGCRARNRTRTASGAAEEPPGTRHTGRQSQRPEHGHQQAFVRRHDMHRWCTCRHTPYLWSRILAHCMAHPRCQAMTKVGIAAQDAKPAIRLPNTNHALNRYLVYQHGTRLQRACRP